MGQHTTALGEPEVHPWIGWLFNQFVAYPWVGFLLILMVLDVFSGITASVVNQKLSSKVSYRGTMRKCGIFLVIGMCAVIEQAILYTLPVSLRSAGLSIPLAKLVAAFFSFYEAISIVENAAKAGVPLPRFLKKALVETFNNISEYGETKVTTEKVIIDKQGEVRTKVTTEEHHKHDERPASQLEQPVPATTPPPILPLTGH